MPEPFPSPRPDGHNDKDGLDTGLDADGNECDEDDNGTVSDANDEDCTDNGDAVDSETEERRRPRKKLCRQETKTQRSGNTMPSMSKKPLFTNGMEGSGRDVGAVLFCVAKESDTIFIRGFFPPKALESKIVFFFIILQDSLSQSRGTVYGHTAIRSLRKKPPPLPEHT